VPAHEGRVCTHLPQHIKGRLVIAPEVDRADLVQAESVAERGTRISTP
jgi:hypothetical protein